MINDRIISSLEGKDKNDTRSGFGLGLLEAGAANPEVVALCADLTGSLKMDAFKKQFPNRFFQVGIAEANMMGLAAGMTIGGKIPFTGTFANFSTGRVYDQIRQSIAYSGKNVKICASHAGVTLGEDGATHQILEDIGMMSMLPHMTVICPADFEQTRQATRAIANHDGPVYLRFGRPKVAQFIRHGGGNGALGLGSTLGGSGPQGAGNRGRCPEHAHHQADGCLQFDSIRAKNGMCGYGGRTPTHRWVGIDGRSCFGSASSRAPGKRCHE